MGRRKRGHKVLGNASPQCVSHVQVIKSIVGTERAAPARRTGVKREAAAVGRVDDGRVGRDLEVHDGDSRQRITIARVAVAL